MNEPDDIYKSLIDRCKRGSTDAKRELYERLFGLVYKVSLRYLKDEHDAKDMTQDCFIKLFESLDKFNRRGSFEGWVATMTTNKCLDHLKRVRPDFLDFEKAELFLKTENDESYEREKFQSEHERVKKALDQLTDGYRTVVLMYALQGYKHREIAEILGIAEGTSKSMYARGKQILLDILKTTEYTNE